MAANLTPKQKTFIEEYLIDLDATRSAIRLVDGDLAFVQARDLVGVHVHAGHVVADLSEACAHDQADVAGTDDRDVHGALASNRLT